MLFRGAAEPETSEEKIKRLAKDGLELMDEYQFGGDIDPNEALDEYVRVVTDDEELSPEEVSALIDEIDNQRFGGTTDGPGAITRDDVRWDADRNVYTDADGNELDADTVEGLGLDPSLKDFPARGIKPLVEDSPTGISDSDQNLGKDDVEDLFDYLRRWDVIDGDIRRAVKSELSDVLEERQVSIDDVRNAIDGLYDSNDFDSGDLDKAFDEIAKEIRSQYDTSEPEILVGTREVSDGSATVKVTKDYEKPGDYYVELFDEDGELNDGKYFDPSEDSSMRQFANDLRDQFGPEVHDLIFREKEKGAITRDDVRWDASTNSYTDVDGNELDADTVEGLGLDPTGRETPEAGIEPLEEEGVMPDFLETEFDSMFQAPEGAYKPNIFELYLPKGRQEENSASYSDDPTVLAGFDRGELLTALEEAVVPVGSFEATGFGSLNFGEGEELVPAEAIYEALELQGGYGAQSLAGIYDIAIGDGTTPNMDMYRQMQDDFDKLDTADLQPKLKKESLTDEEARQLNKQISIPQNAQVILDEMNDHVETNEFIQNMADDLVGLSGEYDIYDPDALLDTLDKYLPFAWSDNDDQRQAFKGLWGMLISIDGGSSDPFDRESSFRKPIREAFQRQYGDSWEDEYRSFLNEFGGFPEFASQKMRIVEGQDDLNSDTVAANFFRLMKAASSPNNVQLQRSFGISSANENLLGRYTTVGNIVSIDPRPFSTKDYAGERMLQSWIPRSNDDHRVVLVAEPGSLDSISAVGISWFDGEQEHIGHGDLEIVNVERRESPLPFRVDDFIVTVRRAETSVEDLAAAEASSSADVPSRNIMDVSDWTFVAKKKGGSNPGAFYRDPETGQDYYVKEPISRSHAENETLASVFYDAFGAPSAEVSIGSDNGTVRVVSKLIPGATEDLRDRVNSDDNEYLDQLREHFIVDAWLANWDVAGLTFDNVMTDENGRPVRVDPGGSLMWRAQGEPKSGLGQFLPETDDVPELDTLRNPTRNATSAAVFGSLTEDDLREQAKMLLNMTPSRIDAIVDSVVTDPDEAAFIKERLKNRRQGILDRFGITPEDTDVLGEPMPLGESIGFAAQDLMPGDVTSGDSFTIERIFRDENTPKGKVSVEGYFPGHETQRKEWNEGTIIDAKRGGPTPPKGDNPALHRPKKPYAPTAPAFMGGIAEELEAAQTWDEVKDILKDKDIIFFDYETTGIGGGSQNRPVQLGAVRVRNGEIVDRFNMFMDPQEPLSEWSRENLVDGDGNPLTDDFLQQQTGLAEAHAQFVDWMGPNPIIGAHNLPFDREVLERIAGEENIEFSPDGYIDTLRLSRDIVKKKTKKNPEGTEGHRLGQLLDHYGIEIENWHSADADAASAANLFSNILDDASARVDDPNTLNFKQQARDYDEAMKSHNEAVEQYKNELADYEMAKAVAAAWNCGGGITAAVGDDEDGGVCDVPSVDDLIERATVTPGELSDPDSLTSGDTSDNGNPYDSGEDVPGGVDKYPVEGEPYPPTAQQQDIINTVMDNEDSDVVVRAAAGAGKTSTLLALARRIQKYAPDKRIIYIAFNRSVADEARAKMPGNVEVRTADSISYNWVKTNMPDLMKKSSDPNRLSKPKDIAQHLGLSKWKDVAEVRAAVYQFTISSDRELGPQHFENGIQPGWLEAAQRWWEDIQDPNGKMPFTFNHMKKLWSLSDPDLSDVSSGLKEGADVIFVDEFQDTNDVLGAVVSNQPNTQNVYVGDENQAIYQFMGAKDWLKKVVADFSLPLTQSFRFGPTIARQGNRFLRFKERYLGSPKTFSVEGAGKTPGTLVPRGSMTDADAVLVRTNAGAFKEIRNELLAGRTVGVTKGFKKDLDDFIAAVEWLKGDQSSRGYRPNRMPEDLRQFDNWSQVVDEASKDDSDLSTKLKILTGDVEDIGLEGLKDLASQLKVVKGAGDKKDIETVPDLPQSDLAPGAQGDVGKNVTYTIDEAGVLLGGKTYDVKEDLKKVGAKWDSDRGGWFVKSKIDDDSLRKTLEKIQGAIFKDSEKQGGTVDVVVTTIHQAKGLEWPRVRMGNDFWGPRKDKKTGEWIYPEEPEIHLAYVGVTRAENELDMGGLSWVDDWVADNDPELMPGFVEPAVAAEETDAPDVAPDVAPEVETPSVSEVPEDTVDMAEDEGPKIMYSVQGEAPSDERKASDINETLTELDAVADEILDPESGIIKKPSKRKEAKKAIDSFNEIREAYENGEISAAEAATRLNDPIDLVPEGTGDESDYLETLRDYMIDYRRILDGTFYQRPQGKNLPPIDSSRGYSKDGVFITPGMRVRDKWGYAGTIDRYNKTGWVNVYVVRDIGNPKDPGKKYYQSKGTQHLTTIPEGGDDRPWAYVPGMNLNKLPANWRELATPGEIEAIEQAMAAAEGKGSKKDGSIKPVASEPDKSVKSVSDIASMISGSAGGDPAAARALISKYAKQFDLSPSEVKQLKNLLGLPDDDDGDGGGGTPKPPSPEGGDSPKGEAPSGAPEVPEEPQQDFIVTPAELVNADTVETVDSTDKFSDVKPLTATEHKALVKELTKLAKEDGVMSRVKDGYTALKRYRFSGYSALNALLREEPRDYVESIKTSHEKTLEEREQSGYVIPEDYVEMLNSKQSTTLEEATATQQIIDDLFDEAPSLDRPMILFRGVTSSFGSELEKYEVGEQFTDLGYGSASTSKKKAKDFISPYKSQEDQRDGVVIEILIDEDTRAISPMALINSVIDSGNDTEQEILIDRGTTYQVISKTPATASQPRTIRVAIVSQDRNLSPASEAPEEASIVTSVDEADVNAADIDPDWQTITESAEEYDMSYTYSADDFDYAKRHTKTKDGEVDPDQRSGIAWYQAAPRLINSLLRGLRPELFSSESAVNETIADIEEMDKDFDDAPTLPMDIILYRGLHSDYSDELMDSYEVGDLFTDDGFVSTSTRRSFAESYVDQMEKKIIVEIIAPEDTRAIDMQAYLGEYTSHDGEYEFLLDRGTTFRVISKTTDPDGTTRVMRVAIVSQKRKKIPKPAKIEEVKEEIVEVPAEIAEPAPEDREVLTTEELSLIQDEVDPKFLDPEKSPQKDDGDELLPARILIGLPAENAYGLSLLNTKAEEYLNNQRESNAYGMNQRVRSEGVFTPIIVRRWADGRRSIYDGHHRLLAAYDNNPDFQVPIVIEKVDANFEDEFPDANFEDEFPDAKKNKESAVLKKTDEASVNVTDVDPDWQTMQQSESGADLIAEFDDYYSNEGFMVDEFANPDVTTEQKVASSFLITYQGPDHEQVNKALRGEEEVDEKTKRIVDGLDSLFDSAPTTPKDMILYRGLSGEYSDEMFDSYEVGDLITDAAYASTSADEDISLEEFATDFSGSGRELIVEILVPQGSRAISLNSYLGSYSIYEVEYEVLLDRGTTFRVISKTTDPDGKTKKMRIAVVSQEREPVVADQEKTSEVAPVVTSVDEADVNAADVDPEWQTMLPTKAFTEGDFTELYEDAEFTYVDRHTKAGDYEIYVGLADYAGSTYYEINNILRGTAKLKTGDPSEKFADAVFSETDYELAVANIDVIDRDFDDAPTLPQTMILYRGLHSEYSDELMDSYEVGDLFTDNAYASTTTDRTVAKNWVDDGSGEPRLVLEIVAPEGTQAINMNAYLGGYSQHSYEDEVLLDRGTTFRVISKTTDPDGTTRVMRVAIVSQQRQPIKDIREPKQDAPPPMGDEDEFVDPKFRDVNTFPTITNTPKATAASTYERHALRTDDPVELFNLLTSKASDGGILVANIDGVRSQIQVRGLVFNAETREWDLLEDKYGETFNIPVRKIQPVERTEIPQKFYFESYADDDEPEVPIDIEDMRGLFDTASKLVEEQQFLIAGDMLGKTFVALQKLAKSDSPDAKKADNVLRYNFSINLDNYTVIDDFEGNFIIPNVAKSATEAFKLGFEMAVKSAKNTEENKDARKQIEVEEEDPDAITPTGRPKVVPKERKPISESLVAGVKPLTEAISSLVNREDGNKRIFESSLVNGSDVEDHEIRTNIIVDKESGERRIRLRFKLTAWAGRKHAMAIDDEKVPDAENIRTTPVEILKNKLLDNGDILVDDTEYGSFRTEGGKSYKYDIPTSTGTAVVTLRRATKDPTHIHTPTIGALTKHEVNAPSLALHNMIEVELPIDATEEDISNVLARAGITDLRATTEDDIRILAENRLLSVLASETDPSQNLAAQDIREYKLERIQEKYGITAADVIVETDESGFITYKIPREIAERIAHRVGAHTFEHSTSAASIAAGFKEVYNMSQDEAMESAFRTLFKMLVGNENGESGIKSTVQRFFEGFAVEGQSSKEDLRTGGADYVFLSSKGGDKYRQDYLEIIDDLYGYATFLFNPVEALQRLEFYANYVDRYGRRDPGVDVLNEARAGAYEVMFKHGLSAAAARGLVTTVLGRKKLLEIAKEEGVTEINGVPVERFITYYNTTELLDVEDDLTYSIRHMYEYFKSREDSTVALADSSRLPRILEVINSASGGDKLYNPFDALGVNPSTDKDAFQVSIVGYTNDGDAIVLDARGDDYKVHRVGVKPSSPNYKKSKEITDPKEVRSLMDQITESRFSIIDGKKNQSTNPFRLVEDLDSSREMTSTTTMHDYSAFWRAFELFEEGMNKAKKYNYKSDLELYTKYVIDLAFAIMMTPSTPGSADYLDGLINRLNSILQNHPEARAALAEWMRK